MNKSHNCSSTFFCVNQINQAYRKGLRRINSKCNVPHDPPKLFAFSLGQSTLQNYFCALPNTEQSQNFHATREENQSGITTVKLSFLHVPPSTAGVLTPPSRMQLLSALLYRGEQLESFASATPPLLPLLAPTWISFESSD